LATEAGEAAGPTGQGPTGQGANGQGANGQEAAEVLATVKRSHLPWLARAKGPYKGEIATGDHIIPRSICTELDNVLINLEFMPETLNQNKGAKVGDRQVQLARKWAKAGVLSEAGMIAVEAAR
jgi:hypothetical protein